MPRYILLLIKIALSVGLVWYVFSKIDISDAWLYLRNMSVYVIFAVLALLFIQLVVAALRLRELLALLGARCGVIKVLDVVMIGSFFSQTLISFVGGDAMRIWRIVQANTPVGLAAKGILFDRVAGFVGLMLITVFSLPWLFETVSQPAMRFGLVVTLLVGLGGVFGLFLTELIPTALRRWRAFRWASELSGVAFAILRSKSGLLAIVVLSVAIQLLNIFALYLISRGLEMEVSFISMMVLVPPVLLISMLPISVAGWGVREGAMVVALSLVGASAHQSLALSVCFGLCLAGISLPGGVLWFVSRGHTGPVGANLASKKE